MIMIALLVVSALGALAAFLPAQFARFVSTGLAALAFGLSLAMYATGAGFWHEYDKPWVPGLNLRFHLGVDGISWPLIVLTTLLTLLCCGYSLWKTPDSRLIGLLLAMQTGIVGAFLALDLVLFFVFFEVILLPMYAVIAGWGGPAKRAAARKFVLYTLFGSMLLLLGVYLVVDQTGSADLAAPKGTATMAAFVFLALGFAVKAPLWPLHTWLPDAHSEAPTVGSVMLAGVLLKLGTYGLIRVAIPVAPEAAAKAAPVLGGLAVAAILIGGLVCLAQTELKRLIAYSSVGHMGFVLLGIATMSATGLQAALIGNLAHGLITGLLFFLVGAIKDRTHTGELSQLGGLRDSSPWLAGILGFAALASLGLPGLAGFWGEAFAVIAAAQRGWWLGAALAAVGGALAAAYLLRMLRKVTHGSSPPRLTGPAGYELAAWVPLAVLTIAVGLAPLLITDVTGPAVDALVEAIQR
ncbi:complex I subunit 4 family protein [Longispora albida]|uniref:complex I subunit 4 family protein n=1 Tax=Longispora albida TaxID=203523 RepID=UPI00037562FF|nr:NADH-quinone oxidoreductase subunit M [Longispora albida]